MTKMLCCASLVLYLVICAVAQPSKVIWFSLMVSDGYYLNTSSVLSAVEQEVTTINNNTSILPGYKLQYTIHRHSEVIHSSLYFEFIFVIQCNPMLALGQFLQEMRSDTVILALIGCGCSAATEEVAKVISFWNIPLVSLN